LSSAEGLFTRFEELFKKFLNRPLNVGFASLVSVDLEPTKRDLLRQFFDPSWDKKDPPSKELLMEVVRFIGPPPMRGFEKVEEHVARSFTLALEKLDFEEPKQDAKRGKERIAKFSSRPGLRWEDVTIAFISDNEIRVEAEGFAEQYAYDEIGFDDQRTGGQGKLWLVFRALAMLGGSATMDNLANVPGGNSNVSKDISRLKKILSDFMGIKGSPFFDYKKHQCYQTKFKLRDEQMIGDHRKPEADSDELLQEAYSEETNPKWRRT